MPSNILAALPSPKLCKIRTQGGPGDDVVVVANFYRDAQDGYTIGFPSGGT